MTKETTPLKITPLLRVLCNDLNSESPPLWVNVIPESWALENECFPNVRRKVEIAGGSAVNGWVIWQWANMLITAEAHSIWKSDSGDLIDITPHNDKEQTILFVPDSNVIFEGTVIPSKRAPMTTSPKVEYLIRLLNTRDDMLQQSGVSRTCAFPTPFLLEIQRVLVDITQKASQNDPCPCGSGLKYKECCGPYESM